MGLFKRINFFKGLFMEAEDWKNEQLHRMEKHRFHNKYLHRAGVVGVDKGGLSVSVDESGIALLIAPGYAIDAEGHDLYIPEQRTFDIPALEEFEPPVTIYLSIAYKETPTDRRDNEANPVYSGDAYVEEDTVLMLGTETPDNQHKIELARISLSENPTAIRDAQDPHLPQADELDMLHVPRAGARIANIPEQLGLGHIAEKIMDTTVQVRARMMRQEETSVLIEKLEAHVIAPMYMVSVHALDGARIHWWISSNPMEDKIEYSLHLKCDVNKSSAVLCRVFKMRI